MNTLWTFGCSFTADFPRNNIENDLYSPYKDYCGGEYPEVWPTLLAKKLGYNVNNKATGGSSNYKIIESFLNSFNDIKENDVVIFGWTQQTRFQAPSFEGDPNNMVQILPSVRYNHRNGFLSEDAINQFLINRTHRLWKFEILNWIRFIDVFCKEKNIKSFHWTSDDKIFDSTTKLENKEKFIQSIDHRSLLEYLGSPDFYDGKNIATIKEETEGKIPDIHFGKYGHITQSEYFYNHIVKHLNTL